MEVIKDGDAIITQPLPYLRSLILENILGGKIVQLPGHLHALAHWLEGGGEAGRQAFSLLEYIKNILPEVQCKEKEESWKMS
jgi:hypothetical protein